MDCLEDFYVPLFSDIPVDNPSPVSKKSSMRSPRKRLSKTKETKTVSSRTDSEGYSSETTEESKKGRRKKEKKKRFKSLQT